MDVVHDPGSRFYITDPAGSAQLQYYVPMEGVMNLYHAEVSPALQGKGVAAQLAAAAFAYARQHDQKIIPSCPYIGSWLKRHPEERDLLA